MLNINNLIYNSHENCPHFSNLSLRSDLFTKIANGIAGKIVYITHEHVQMHEFVVAPRSGYAKL